MSLDQPLDCNILCLLEKIATEQNLRYQNHYELVWKSLLIPLYNFVSSYTFGKEF
ncbi:Uncharacterised protein [Vibrio cholerae]|nr:Uncharacterised protein [Vibrio cholerae]CSD21421.1 Uncharacterised protein [Vibrio cholerae]